ncbi:MAG TPA: GreA/GreB family elongation factor, partial [Ornithinibacter sp.]|nr:GreA/GreB family elongation factor [Ornithinibacter sp.]
HVYSEKSPIGAAVNGAKVGDSVSYEAPNGTQIEVKVLATTPYEV